MIPDTRIAVIGLGLMGGSMARALHVRGVYVLGFDRDGTQLEAALRDGAVQEALASDLAGVATAEVVVLARTGGRDGRAAPFTRGAHR
ncbi:MAG: NAD(P)-binding domain-containing protein [Gemmatimonadaceae bacterium]|nr:NAD(P)-binding domain-containing protein [Gemmatimonadaceae bacterium]